MRQLTFQELFQEGLSRVRERNRFSARWLVAYQAAWVEGRGKLVCLLSHRQGLKQAGWL